MMSREAVDALALTVLKDSVEVHRVHGENITRGSAECTSYTFLGSVQLNQSHAFPSAKESARDCNCGCGQTDGQTDTTTLDRPLTRVAACLLPSSSAAPSPSSSVSSWSSSSSLLSPLVLPSLLLRTAATTTTATTLGACTTSYIRIKRVHTFISTNARTGTLLYSSVSRQGLTSGRASHSSSSASRDRPEGEIQRVSNLRENERALDVPARKPHTGILNKWFWIFWRGNPLQAPREATTMPSQAEIGSIVLEEVLLQ